MAASAVESQSGTIKLDLDKEEFKRSSPRAASCLRSLRSICAPFACLPLLSFRNGSFNVPVALEAIMADTIEVQLTALAEVGNAELRRRWTDLLRSIVPAASQV